MHLPSCIISYPASFTSWLRISSERLFVSKKSAVTSGPNWVPVPLLDGARPSLGRSHQNHFELSAFHFLSYAQLEWAGENAANSPFEEPRDRTHVIRAKNHVRTKKEFWGKPSSQTHLRLRVGPQHLRHEPVCERWNDPLAKTSNQISCLTNSTKAFVP
jgi:hypothetical protein